MHAEPAVEAYAGLLALDQDGGYGSAHVSHRAGPPSRRHATAMSRALDGKARSPDTNETRMVVAAQVGVSLAFSRRAPSTQPSHQPISRASKLAAMNTPSSRLPTSSGLVKVNWSTTIAASRGLRKIVVSAATTMPPTMAMR